MESVCQKGPKAGLSLILVISWFLHFSANGQNHPWGLAALSCRGAKTLTIDVAKQLAAGSYTIKLTDASGQTKLLQFMKL